MLGYCSFLFRYPGAVAVHHAGAAPVAGQHNLMHRGTAAGKFTGQSDLARLASVISLQASSPGGRCQAATVAGRIQSKHQVIVAAVGTAKG